MKALTLITLMLCLGGKVFGLDSLNVRRVGLYDTPNQAVSVAVSGNYALIADGQSGLRIINITNPATPTEVGFFDTPGFAYGVAVSGSYAYVADDYTGGLRIINITNPATPTEVGFYDTPGGAFGVTVNGSYAYVADRWSGLRIINITNPATPTEAGFYDTPNQAVSVAVSGNYALIADGQSGLRIINITNPATPTEVGFFDTPGFASGVAVNGSYAYVADGESGLRIINITNPATPTEVGFYDTPDRAVSVAVSGSYAFVADDDESGLRIINITNPATPNEVGYYNEETSGGNFYAVALSGDFAFVAEMYNGLGIFDVSYFTGLRLLYPNGGESSTPFSADTIRWEGGDLSDTSISITLNRHYPIGEWETITDSTENDGEFEWFVTDPLSDSCRIRICASQDTFCDISDSNFSIVSSQGYLGLIRSSAPNTPVTGWNAGEIECPSGATQAFRFKNFGSEPIVAFQPLDPTSAEFSRTTTCGSFFALAPGGISTCSVTVSFSPTGEGVFYDTLRIQTDAVNGVGGYVSSPLSGSQIRTPESPEVVISTAANNAVLRWSPIVESIGYCQIDPPSYLVFFAENNAGPFWFHGVTADTVYTHVGAVQYTSAMFYHVYAVRAEPGFLAELSRWNPNARLPEADIMPNLAKSSGPLQ